MVDYNRLIVALQKELECQKKLLELIARERAALVSFNAEKVSAIADEKQEVLEYAEALQGKRNQILKTSNQGQEETVKLENIIKHCSSPQLKKELSGLRKDLATTVKAVKTLNDHNAELIKQSMGIISSTLAILRSAPETELPIYGLNAKLNTVAQDPAFGPRSKTLVREA